MYNSRIIKNVQETLTVEFGGQTHQVDLQTFAYSVLNFSSVIKEVNRRLGGSPLDIHITAPKKGSVIVDIVTTLTNNAVLIPPTIEFTANLMETIGGAYLLHQFISGKKTKEPKKVADNVEIELEDGSKMQVAENIYNIYTTTPAIPNSISNHFSALKDDPAVTDFKVKTSREKKIIDISREDYARMAIKQQFETENSRTIVESATLYIYKVVFDKTDRKWEFYHAGNRISANVADNDFFKKIDKGESFAKGDQLKVDLQVNQVFDDSVGTFVNQSYQVMKVHEHVKRTEPLELPFDKKIDA